MNDAARDRFDELVTEATQPPAHRHDFEAHLAAGLHETDDGRGSSRALPKRRRRAVLIAAALVGLAIAVPAVILSGSSSAPSPADLQRISTVIDRWQAVDFLPWPAEYYGEKELPPAVHRRMRADRQTVAGEVGSGAFLRSEHVLRDQAATLEAFRKSGEPIVVASEARAKDVSYARTEFNGDVVVRVVVWQGETTAFWNDAKQRLVSIHKTDATPVYEYVMNHSKDGWRIVDVHQIEVSSDASAEYGPNTPHQQEPIPVPGEM